MSNESCKHAYFEESKAKWKKADAKREKAKANFEEADVEYEKAWDEYQKSRVAPPEPSLDEVIAAVRAKIADAHYTDSLGVGVIVGGCCGVIGNSGMAYHLDGNEEAAWRDALRKMEAVEGEAKPPIEICYAVAPGRNSVEKHGCLKKKGHVGLHANGNGVSWPQVATPTAPPEVVELPPLNVDVDDVWYARNVGKKEGHTVAVQLICRERQLRAEHFAHAQTKAALAEAVDAIREHLADGKHVGPRSERLRKIAATEGSK